MNLESTITDVIENVATFPKLAIGTATSFIGTIAGNAPSIESVPKLQYLVWGASFLAAAATVVLACMRGYIEWRKAKQDKII